MELTFSVCIATYKRESLLEKLLISLKNQLLPPDFKLEIVVTDNNFEASAQHILKKFTDTENICFKYFVQPEKNISLARNTCLANAKGDFICFIDDDETASEYWIWNLYETLKYFNADGVFGYVEAVFAENIPFEFQNREFYFSPVGGTGTKAFYLFTTNVLIKSNLIKNEKVPFDPEYGLTGGEDVHLFERLERKGAKFIISREAISYEHIPAERATKKYLYNRALRGGQAFIRRKLNYNRRFTVKFFILLKAAIMIIYSAIFYSIIFFSKYNQIKMLIILGSSIGKIRSLFNKFKIMH